MRKDVSSARKKILAVEGIGMKKTAKGMRHRKTVAGSRIHEKISLINLKVLKHGRQKLDGEEAQPGPEGAQEKAAGQKEQADAPGKEEAKKEGAEKKEEEKEETKKEDIKKEETEKQEGDKGEAKKEETKKEESGKEEKENKEPKENN